MEIKPISQNQPNFRGYIGPNLKKYVNGTVHNEVQQIVRNANSKSKSVDTKQITDIKLLGETILNNFSKYLAKTNKKTKFDLNDTDSDYIRFYFENPIAPDKKIKVYPSTVFDEVVVHEGYIAIPTGRELNTLSNSGEADLHKLMQYCKKLHSVNPKDTDKIFLNSAESTLETQSKKATGFFAKRKVRKTAKQIEEFAKEMGAESTATVRVEEYLKFAKESKLKYLQRKQLEKENQKVADKILNS